MKKVILILLGFSSEERYLFNSILSARRVQDFLWGNHNLEWDLEEWKRMLRKRVSKLDSVNSNNPHAKVEIKKRVLQITAVGINFLSKLDSGEIQNKCNITSNLPEYKKK